MDKPGSQNKDKTLSKDKTHKTKKNIITWNEKGQPNSNIFNDIYFSVEDGLNESRYVFIENNRLVEKWTNTYKNNSSTKTADNKEKTFTIFETGFGSGLNFIATWQAWENTHRALTSNESALSSEKESPEEFNKNDIRQLHFISVEKYPLCTEDILKSSNLWPELKDYYAQLIKTYPALPCSGVRRLSFQSPFGLIKLTLYFGDLTAAIDEFSYTDSTKNLTYFKTQTTRDQPIHFNEYFNGVDAWFLDGFAPSKNPEMWTEQLYKAMAIFRRPKQKTSFATFTAASEVRKGLIKSGFSCEKVKGFGRKREMLIGEYDNNSILNQNHDLEPTTKSSQAYEHIPFSSRRQLKPSTSWLSQKSHAYQKKNSTNATTPQRHVVIIGGGLAGCHSAYALAKRGFHITIIDSKKSLATAASGNIQGLVYTRLSPHNNALNQFNLSAQTFADQFYTNENLYHSCGEQKGIFHCAYNEKQTDQYRTLAQRYANENKKFITWINKSQTQEICGVELNYGGLWLKNSGWLQPPKLCETLCQHPLISTIFDEDINRLVYTSDTDKPDSNLTWQCFNQQNTCIASADYVVICNANNAKNFEQTRFLPTKSIRGQVSYIKATDESKKLTTPLCGEGYIAPVINNTFHSCGASFTLENHSPELSQDDEQANLEKIVKLSDIFKHSEILKNQLKNNNLNINTNQSKHSRGRVAFRTTSPDYFPIVGPVPQQDAFLNTFSELRKNAKAKLNIPGDYHPGLYCHVALGSRGLAYAPICAELLADLIDGSFLCIGKNIYQHLNPARFLIRGLVRGEY